MSESYSYLWDFTSVPSFFDEWNEKFKIAQMGASNNFQFVFCNYTPNNINDCLSNGVLSNQVTPISGGAVDCGLVWDSDARTISIVNDTTWNIGDNIHNVKAVFLRNKSNNYVMGYCIHQNAFEVTNKVKIPKGTILWSIQDG